MKNWKLIGFFAPILLLIHFIIFTVLYHKFRGERLDIIFFFIYYLLPILMTLGLSLGILLTENKERIGTFIILKMLIMVGTSFIVLFVIMAAHYSFWSEVYGFLWGSGALFFLSILLFIVEFYKNNRSINIV